MGDTNSLISHHILATTIVNFLNNLVAVVRTSEDMAYETRERDRITALSHLKPGGFSDEIFIFLSEREKVEYVCSICYSMMNNVHQCSNGHKFCYSCIYVWSSCNRVGADFCPTCRCDGFYAKNEQLNDKMGAKRVRCQEENCNWRGYLKDFVEHEHRYYGLKELRRPTQLPHPESTEPEGGTVDRLDVSESICDDDRSVQGHDSETNGGQASAPSESPAPREVESTDSPRMEYHRLTQTYSSRRSVSPNGEEHLVMMFLLLTSDSLPPSSQSAAPIAELTLSTSQDESSSQRYEDRDLDAAVSADLVLENASMQSAPLGAPSGAVDGDCYSSNNDSGTEE